MKPFKMAMINDLTGFGHCSLAVAIPIISVMGVQACPVPTGIFSNHMAFPEWHYTDFTHEMSSYLSVWERLSLSFDGISCGFLGNEALIPTLSGFFKQQKDTYGTCILLDPVMGDHGRAYSSVTPSYQKALTGLCSLADILTPNLTEACFLTGTAYPEELLTDASDRLQPLLLLLSGMAAKLHGMGIGKVVITGIKIGNFFGNYVSASGSGELLFSPAGGPSRPGTGDIFAAILSADAVKGVPFTDSVKKAAEFVRICTVGSAALNIPIVEGVCLEQYLSLAAGPVFSFRKYSLDIYFIFFSSFLYKIQATIAAAVSANQKQFQIPSAPSSFPNT